MKKPSANERRLDKLIADYYRLKKPRRDGQYESLPAYLIRFGVLAICAATVHGSDAALCLASYDEQRLRVHLRAMARGR